MAVVACLVTHEKEIERSHFWHLTEKPNVKVIKTKKRNLPRNVSGRLYTVPNSWAQAPKQKRGELDKEKHTCVCINTDIYSFLTLGYS